MVSPSQGSLASDSASDDDLAVWMAEYGPGLKRYFTRRAGADQADDLVQEVFLRLRARSGDDPVDNVEGYLFRVARNVRLGLGAQVTQNFVPAALEPLYAGDPKGAMAFIRLKID